MTGKTQFQFGFPILVWNTPESKKLAKQVIKSAKNLKDKDPFGGLVSDKWRTGEKAKTPDDFADHGYTSYHNQNLVYADPDEWGDIHRFVLRTVEKYTSEVGWANEPAFKIPDSWVTVYGRSHYIPEHIHALSHLSFVYYASATKGTGQICFKNPALPMYAMVHENGKNLWHDMYEVQPEKGTIIVFPSFIPHATKPHESDEERIIFSGNVRFSDFIMNEVSRDAVDVRRLSDAG